MVEKKISYDESLEALVLYYLPDFGPNGDFRKGKKFFVDSMDKKISDFEKLDGRDWIEKINNHIRKGRKKLNE